MNSREMARNKWVRRFAAVARNPLILLVRRFCGGDAAVMPQAIEIPSAADAVVFTPIPPRALRFPLGCGSGRLSDQQGDPMTLIENADEIADIERQLRDLAEAIEDAADLAAATRLRVQRRAMLRRLEELQDHRLDMLRAV